MFNKELLAEAAVKAGQGFVVGFMSGAGGVIGSVVVKKIVDKIEKHNTADRKLGRVINVDDFEEK